MDGVIIWIHGEWLWVFGQVLVQVQWRPVFVGQCGVRSEVEQGEKTKRKKREYGKIPP